MKKEWYQSKTVWGMTGFLVMSLLADYTTTGLGLFESLKLFFLTWAGIGARFAIK